MLKSLLKTAAEILLEKRMNKSLGVQNTDSKPPGNHIHPHLVQQHFEIL